jgi:acetyl esterase/lipase
MDLIAEEDRFNASNWNKSNLLTTNASNMSERATQLLQDKNVGEKLLLLFNDEISPGLVDDRILSRFPKTNIFVCERDLLRDSQFMFAGRMRRLGVNVTVQVYDSCHEDACASQFRNSLDKIDLLQSELG